MDFTSGDVPSNSSSATGEDLLSGLPNDILVLILLPLGRVAAASAAAASGQTSVLSPPMVPPLALLSELRFPVTQPPHLIASVHTAHHVSLRHLHVETVGAAPESMVAWLPIDSHRLFVDVFYRNVVPRGGEEVMRGKGALWSYPTVRMTLSPPSTFGFSASSCRT
jgi:hypothetical protein